MYPKNLRKVLAGVVVCFLLFAILMTGIAHAVTLGDPFPVAATAGPEAAISAAFDGTNYLIGVQGDAIAHNNITAQLISQSGISVGSRISVGRTGGAPLVAFDGTNYLMVWFDDATANGQLYGVFIGKYGLVVNTPFVIDPGPLSGSRDIGGVAFGGGKYMVVYYKTDAGAGRDIVYGRLVSPSGTVGNEIRISTGYGKQGLNNVAFDGTNFFVVWDNHANDNEVKGRFVSPSGTLGTEITVKASGLDNDNPLTVAFDGINYLVVWTDQVSANNWDVFGQLVTPTGAISGGKISVSTAPGQQFLPYIAFDGTNYLISWTDMRNDTNGNWACDTGEGTCWDIRGQFVGKSGALIGSELIINNDAGNQLGGFTGQAANGKLFGLVNAGVNVAQDLFGDVYGVSMTVENISIGTGTHNASGSYTWNSTTGVMAFNWTSTDFTCDGPDLGTNTNTGVTVAATTMTWANDNMTWTRSSGTAGDMVGIWTSTDTATGNSYTLTFNANGMVSVTGIIVLCGGGGGQNPSAYSQHWSSGYYVQLQYDDSPKTATAVSVTGTGIAGTEVLTYNAGGGSWNSWTSPSTNISFGTTYPAGLPYTYTFTITDAAGTRTATSTVSCFQAPFATNISPTGSVTGTPTFSWTGIADPSAVYAVELRDGYGNDIWHNYHISGTSIVYNGTALTSGMTYNYNVNVQNSSACSNGTSFAQGSFTYGNGGADTTAPTVPTGVNAVAVGPNQVDISWNISTDNVGVTYYQVYRNGLLVGTPAGPTNNFWPDNSVVSNTIYSYSVVACDAANNCSAQSGTVTIPAATRPMVAAGGNRTLGLKADGTVVGVGDNDYGQLDATSWTGITQVAAGGYHTAGLKASGTVVAVGFNDYGQLDVTSWTGITQVAAGGHHTVGLKADGGVVAVGIYGFGQLNVTSWTGITQVAAGFYHTVGLKADGTVVAVGNNDYGQLDVTSWTGITQVAAGGRCTVGLKADGSVVAAGVGYNNDLQFDVTTWTGIVQVAAGYLHIVGLKADGTVVAMGQSIYGQLDVTSWTGITQVAAGGGHTVGLKADGTVVAVGLNNHRQLDVTSWNLGQASTSGVCGTSNGQTFTSAPTANLCSVGTPTSVSGSGPWTWNCNGSGGGTNDSCSANLSIGFTEDFSAALLDPSWQVVSGLGRYSLSDHPGYLRYYLEGPKAYSGSWTGSLASGWSPSLTLIRPFNGDHWVLTAKASYNIRWQGTGAQHQALYLAFGDEGKHYLCISRGTDQWYGTNILLAELMIDSQVVASNYTLRAPNDVLVDDWLRFTYWYEIVRHGQCIALRYSDDGTNYKTVFSSSLATSAATQRVILDANVWTTADSYTDWDYIQVDPTAIPTLGDVNGDSTVNLADALLALQVMPGMSPAGIRTNYPTCGADVNCDGQVGLAEQIYILQKVAGLRSASPDTPSAPTGVTATAGNSGVTVSWTAAAGPTSYNIYWATTSGVTKTNGAKITNATSSYSHTGLTNGTTYYYLVTAVNSFGEGEESAQVSATPTAAGTGTYTASGTYTWNLTTSVITLNWTSSNFTCNGPSLGTETKTGVTITSTTMTWPNDNMTWSRSSGTANDIIGTWAASDSETGNSYTVTVNANGTVSVVGVIVQCGGDNRGVTADAQHWSGGYSVQLYYQEPNKTASSVSVTGHGITGSKALAYNTSWGQWDSWTSPSTPVSFGTTYPTGLPYTYTFSITDATTWTATSTVSCFQEKFATNISPTGTVTGTPTFSWTGISDSSAKYGVQVNDSSYNQIWENNNISGTSIVYGGPALTSGATYNYNVLVTSSSTCNNESSFAQGSFTYQ